MLLIFILFLLFQPADLQEVKATTEFVYDDDHFFWYEPWYSSIFRWNPYLEKNFGYPFGYNWWCSPYWGRAYGGCPEWYGYPNYPNVWKFGFGRGKYCSFCMTWSTAELKNKDAYDKCKKYCDMRKKKDMESA